MAKPFSPRELVARVKAVLRRLEGPAAAVGPAPGASSPDALQPLTHGRLRLDVNLYQAFWDTAGVPLTATEFYLVKALFGFPVRSTRATSCCSAPTTTTSS